MISIHIVIEGHTLVSRLKGVYGSSYRQTRLQTLVRGFTPMFILLGITLAAKIILN